MNSLFLSLCLYFSRSVYLSVRFGNGFPKHLEKKNNYIYLTLNSLNVTNRINCDIQMIFDEVLVRRNEFR